MIKYKFINAFNVIDFDFEKINKYRQTWSIRVTFYFLLMHARDEISKQNDYKKAFCLNRQSFYRIEY